MTREGTPPACGPDSFFKETNNLDHMINITLKNLSRNFESAYKKMVTRRKRKKRKKREKKNLG